MNQTSKVIDSPFFTTNILHFNQGIKKDYSQLDSFVMLFNVEGSCLLDWGAEEKMTLKAGEVVLIPNLIHAVALYPDTSCKILEVYIQ
jgi:mannose-6-phosphate isomerase